MTKSGKKKNSKLRRRVQRTIAAVTMITAVVVAAIPVESFGTMQAADTRSTDNVKLSDDYTKATNDGTITDESSYGNAVNDVVQYVVGSTIIDTFKISTKTNNTNDKDAMISEYIADTTDLETLNINSQGYCGYVQFDNDFLNNIEAAFIDTTSGQSTIKASFGKTQTPISGFSYTDNNNTTVTVNNKTIEKYNTTVSNWGSSIALNISGNTDAQGYAINGNISIETIYTGIENTFWQSHINRINTYNTQVDGIITRLNAAAANKNITDWNSAVAEYDSLANSSTALATLTNNYTDFKADEGTGNAIANYLILDSKLCKSAAGNILDSSYKLKTLMRVSTINNITGKTVYVPQYQGTITDTMKTYLDPNGYLTIGNYKIVGIGNEAFSKNTLSGRNKIQSVSIPDSVLFIGKKAFAGLTNLNSVKLSAGITKIGNSAFADSGITELNIPFTVKEIDKCAFANTSLQNLTFDSNNNLYKIGEFAFYNCIQLKTITFPNEPTFDICDAAFAVNSDIGGLEEFTFPLKTVFSMNSAIPAENRALANRTSLAKVTLPQMVNNSSTETIPDGIFRGCFNIGCVVFPEGAGGIGYTPEILFKDIYNEEFYVEGPAYSMASSSDPAKPRKLTWEAKAGEDGSDWKLTSVPYKFKDKDGNTHIEIGIDEKNGIKPAYLVQIDVTSENPKEAIFTKYSPSVDNKIDTSDDRIRVRIPSEVAGYKVVGIGKGCFSEDIKKIVYRLDIEDDSITTIDAEAFKGASALQWVRIGDSVTSIGTKAFADCPMLQDVEFSQNIVGELEDPHDPEWSKLTIADDAFDTGSELLTFHGAISPDYAPFKIAMSDKRAKSSASRANPIAQICYKTDAPLNLTVIRNRADGKATLVDYPYYSDIKESIRKQFEGIYINGTDTTGDMMDVDQEKEVRQTLHMELPVGIESIDSKSFFDSKSGNNVDYKYVKTYNVYYDSPKEPADSLSLKSVTGGKIYKPEDITNRAFEENKGTNNTKELYSQDNYPSWEEKYAQYINKKAKEEDTIAPIGGLFSGGFYGEQDRINSPKSMWGVNTTTNEPNKYMDHTYLEKYDAGNDHLTSIDLGSIESLPDYAFDSCENLQHVTIGAEMNEMGRLPFRGCMSLGTGEEKGITIKNNAKYTYENLILYETLADGTLKVLECMEGRGLRSTDTGDTDGVNYGSLNISVSTDSKLGNATEIAEGAFSNCRLLQKVDLTDTNIDTIPVKAFENDDALREVILPKSVGQVLPFAFDGACVKGTLTVKIPNPNCILAADAFNFNKKPTEDTSLVIIAGVKYANEQTQELSACYKTYEQIKKKLKESGQPADEMITFEEYDSVYSVTFVDKDEKVILYKGAESQSVPKGKDAYTPEPPVITGWKFTEWSCMIKPGQTLYGEEAYQNVTEDRIIRANYEPDPNSIVNPDNTSFDLTVVNGYVVVDGSNIIETFPTKIIGGSTVMIGTNDANFKVWTINPAGHLSLILSPTSKMTNFTMPMENVVITANTAISGGDEPTPDGKYTVTVNSGTGSGTYAPGETVTITANAPAAGQSFTGWTTTTTGVTFASSGSTTTTFVMPAANVTVTANYTGSGSDDPNDPNKKYKLTVNYGTGSGEYAAGETVTITANPPDSSRRVFSRWTTNNSTVTLASATSATTTLVMPAADLTVTANYRSRSDDDDDDDDDNNNRRPGTNTNTSTVPNRPGNSTNTNGTTGTVSNNTNGTNGNNGNNGSNNDGGSRIYITKNGVSNKDLASVSVSGSTDNFIVKITESEEATAAVEEALINRYGSLDGLAYFPMDISLYDSTGQNKITDTYGLNITVTMPIPDVLIQYGGNNRVAAADNGNLQQLTPRFTTIDGIACISFVPPHFSPYVIYVDTNNLTAGQTLDSTPKTGDPIHPKWFAAIGMACLSVILFVTSDGRGRKRKKLTV